MKRFILLLVCCSFLVGNSVYALSKVEVDGLFYYLNEDDKTAILTKGWPLYSGDVIIPETINYEGKTYSVTKIDGGAFSKCKDLNSVTISEGVKEIGSYSFYSCKRLSSVILPDGLTSIGEEAFEECTSLTSLVIPNTVSEIHRGAFWKSGINNINIPTKLEAIVSVAFAQCPNLTQIIIPNNIKIIEQEAFGGSGLKNISIPSSVIEIGYQAFNCESLESVVIEESEEPLTLYAHWGTNYTFILKPDGGLIDNKPGDVQMSSDKGLYHDLPVPVKTGFHFMGWYVKNGGTESKVDNNMECTSSQELTAHWEKVDVYWDNRYSVASNNEAFTDTFTADDASIAKGKAPAEGEKPGFRIVKCVGEYNKANADTVQTNEAGKYTKSLLVVPANTYDNDNNKRLYRLILLRQMYGDTSTISDDEIRQAASELGITLAEPPVFRFDAEQAQ